MNKVLCFENVKILKMNNFDSDEIKSFRFICEPFLCFERFKILKTNHFEFNESFR